MPDEATAAHIGRVAAVRGSVVDVRFDDRLPLINSVLRTGTANEIVIEVMTQFDADHVRGIALTPTQGLSRGMPVTDTGLPLQAPVGPNIISRMFDVFGRSIDRDLAVRAQEQGGGRAVHDIGVAIRAAQREGIA